MGRSVTFEVLGGLSLDWDTNLKTGELTREVGVGKCLFIEGSTATEFDQHIVGKPVTAHISCEGMDEVLVFPSTCKIVWSEYSNVQWGGHEDDDGKWVHEIVGGPSLDSITFEAPEPLSDEQWAAYIALASAYEQAQEQPYGRRVATREPPKYRLVITTE
jgi:hypothetical protein